ncbi:MAG: transcriptional repressor [Geopsychrobacter sp.]|nr:transcriptional repressor [Geopsychrobacter sp.]
MEHTLKQQLSAFEDACRKAGLRLTPQRLEIFRELAKAADHPSAETLHQRLVKGMPTLSLDTVYRTLGTFAGHGLIHKVQTVESQARFEVAQLLHHHLTCRNCKEIIDFHWQFIDEAVLPEEVHSWGRIERKNVVVYGTCHKCMKSSAG